MTQEEILEDFSKLTCEDIKAGLAFAADREKLTRVNTHFFVGRYHQHQGVVIHERSQILI